MSSSAARLRLDIGLAPDAEAAELDDAVSQLRTELLGLDVGDVQRPPGRKPPSGAKGLELGLLGALVVSAGRNRIRAIVRTLESWVARSASRTVKLTLDGDCIELTNVSDDQQQRLIDAFVARHAAGPP